jgi:hypothetical protein
MLFRLPTIIIFYAAISAITLKFIYLVQKMKVNTKHFAHQLALVALAPPPFPQNIHRLLIDLCAPLLLIGRDVAGEMRSVPMDFLRLFNCPLQLHARMTRKSRTFLNKYRSA